MKKISSIKQIDNPFFNIKIGTFDKKSPKTVFIEGSTYIIPNFEEGFSDTLFHLKKAINNGIKIELCSNHCFENKFIDILEVPEERMKYGKKSYLYFECHLRQKGEKDFNSLLDETCILNDKILEIVYNAISNNGFSISKNR